jgi:GT2 family glycosyltransferase
VESGIDIYNPPLGLRSIGLSDKDLSIIIVNYKSWGVLQQCLDSFNRYPPKLNYEIVVVDNDSQDGQLGPFSQKYPTVKFVNNSGNYGFSNGCNLGSENAIGEYLLFLNPDVILTDSPAIDKMVSFAKENPDVGVTSCRTINPKGKPEREIAFLNPWLTIGWLRALYRLIYKKKISKSFPDDHNIWYPDWIAGSVVTINKEFFKQVGRWSQQHFWMYSEDPDLCKKTHDQNKKIALLRNVELKHAHGGSSRRNPKTTAITKSEVVTSSHVFVQIHTKGINRIALHSLMIVNTLISWLLRTLLTLPVFWKSSFQSNLLTLVAIVQYYSHVPARGTWKSKRLDIK